eukprot:749802-Rhodomonas_salina.1
MPQCRHSAPAAARWHSLALPVALARLHADNSDLGLTQCARLSGSGYYVTSHGTSSSSTTLPGPDRDSV